MVIRRGAAALLVLSVSFITIVIVGPGSTPAALAVTGEAPVTTFVAARYGDIATDPVTGRVLVTADDAVRVFSPEGQPVATIGDVYGAAGMAIDGRTLWVAMTTAGSYARIDLDSLTLVQVLSAGVTVPQSFVVLDGKIWFSGIDGTNPNRSLRRLDPATGAVTDQGGSLNGGYHVAPVPGSSSQFLWGNSGTLPFSLVRVDTTTSPVRIKTLQRAGSTGSLRDLAATDHGTFLTASGAPYNFPEYALDTMQHDGRVYSATHYPGAITWSPARGGLFAASTGSTNKVFVYRDGGPSPAETFTVAGTVVDHDVALAPDGDHVYALVQLPSSTWGLVAHRLVLPQPEVTGLSPSSGPAAGGTAVTISGLGLEAATAVRFGDVAASSYTVIDGSRIDAVSPPGHGLAEVSVRMPTGATAPASNSWFTYDEPPPATEPLAPTAVLAAQDRGGLAVDPVTGRVFVAADDEIHVFDPDGRPLARIADVPGGRGMTSGLGAVWVTMPTSGSLARLDPVDLTSTVFPVDMPIGDSVAVIDGAVWFTSTNYLNAQLIARFDPGTAIATVVGSHTFGGRVAEIPRSATRGLFFGPALGGQYVMRMKVSPTSVSFEQTNSNVTVNTDLLATARGTAVTMSGQEFSLGTLQPTGVVYPAGGAIDYATVDGGLLATEAPSVNRVRVFRDGSLATLVDFTMADAIVPEGLRLAPDGSHVYALTSVSAESVGLVVHDLPDRAHVQGAVTGGRSGAPIPGARVVALRRADLRHGGTATADGEGRYDLGVDPGDYFVYAFDSTGVHGPAFAGAPTAVSVGQGGTATADVVLEPALGRLTGSVTDADTGEPIADAWVTLLDAHTARPGPAAATEPDGSYHIDGVSAGPHLVLVSDPSGEHEARFGPEAAAPDDAEPIEVTAGESTAFDLALPRLPSAPATREATISGTVHEATSGDPLPGVWVFALSSADFRFAGATRTDASGGYDLDVPVGSHLVGFLDPSGRHAMTWHHGQQIGRAHV